MKLKGSAIFKIIVLFAIFQNALIISGLADEDAEGMHKLGPIDKEDIIYSLKTVVDNQIYKNITILNDNEIVVALTPMGWKECLSGGVSSQIRPAIAMALKNWNEKKYAWNNVAPRKWKVLLYRNKNTLAEKFVVTETGQIAKLQKSYKYKTKNIFSDKKGMGLSLVANKDLFELVEAEIKELSDESFMQEEGKTGGQFATAIMMGWVKLKGLVSVSTSAVSINGAYYEQKNLSSIMLCYDGSFGESTNIILFFEGRPPVDLPLNDFIKCIYIGAAKTKIKLNNKVLIDKYGECLERESYVLITDIDKVFKSD